MRTFTNDRRRRLLGTAVTLAIALAVSSLAWVATGPQAAAATTPTWSSLSPSASPPPLVYASMAYDRDNGTIVLFGGQTGSGGLSATTWVWNGSTWSQTGSSVPARAHASMAFDPQLHQLILFGGVGTGGQLLDDTWAWNGATWYPETGQDPSQVPSAREGASLAFDANDQLVLYGGSGAAANTTSTPSPGPAVPTSGGPAASGTAGVASTAAQPAATVLGDTWVWTGSAWAKQNVSGPPARTDANLAWDPMTSQTVMFGGSSGPTGTTPASGLLAETWVWGAGSWGPVAPATSPPPSEDLTLAADPDLGGLIAFGGAEPSGLDATTWIWNGVNWADLGPTGTPAPRQGAAAAYDAAAHQLVLFGGVGAAGNLLGDTEVLAAQAPSSAVPVPSTPPTTTVPPAHRATTTTTMPSRITPVSHPAGAGPTTTTAAPLKAKASGPPPSVTLQLHPGGLMTLHGAGFRPATAITITFHSTPYLVGRTAADSAGGFSATVAVPQDASPGLHHFEASGMGASGAGLLLVTPVEVVLRAVGHDTLLRTLAMVAISVALPAGCWVFMEVRGRRRSATRAA